MEGQSQPKTNISPKRYAEFVAKNVISIMEEVAGSAAAVYWYSHRVPQDEVWCINHVGVSMFTTLFGDYTTAKFVAIGVERSGKLYTVDIRDINTAYGIANAFRTRFCLLPGDRIFAYIEATSTSETYHISVSGTNLCEQCDLLQ